MRGTGLGDSLGGLSFLRRYGSRLTAAAFPALAANRRQLRTSCREILLFGDSHGWGQGSADYDGRAHYSTHMSFPYNKGFYARLGAHVRDRLEFGTELLFPEGGGESMKLELAGPVRAPGFYGPAAFLDRAREHLGYLAEQHVFGSEVWTLGRVHGTDGEATPAEFRIPLKSPASMLFIGVVADPDGAALEVRIEAPYYYAAPSGYPKLFLVEGGTLTEAAEPVRNSGSGTIVIDTFAPEPQERVYGVDFGMKRKGNVVLRLAGERRENELCEHAASGMSGERRGSRAILRGVIPDLNRVRNFSMGGHTVGQWLGDGTASFNDGPYDHVDELLRYVAFTPTLAVIQAPVVNEYLRQTPIREFEAALEALVLRLNRHLNADGSRRTDVLMFTTLGDRGIAFEGEPSLSISYEDYYEAIRRFCTRGSFGLIEFHRFFEDAVRDELVDVDLLFDDAIHPGPFANEWIAQGLIAAFDLVW
ncbi:SGNH/GDSL hydrolase family protein [Cohnella hashimotonis]|uniref:SGNH/GDSL hydrolase family protein n=1 Tax=Cohnella hashimotonis TaxID=2826895 RepID=A0ABT6TJM1_9BACL|nr:SGNH/GDSL hydrolase family protein [Cohnella hashimotonis]MDI4647042.1 SGNH/GDSL hydrolase family protein [Cohnella hashimotonis]